MGTTELAERHFTVADQHAFAGACGDRNPIHLDAVVARRTMAGAMVVHGIHTLLWGLDSLFCHLGDSRGVAGIDVTFTKIVYVGDRVRAVLLETASHDAQIRLMVDDVAVLRCKVAFGDPTEDCAGEEAAAGDGCLLPAQPVDLKLDQMPGRHGRLAFAAGSPALGRMFPAASRILGLARVAGLGCSSSLVGMVCPGLHSLYGGLDLRTTRQAAAPALRYRVADVDDRFRRVRLAMSGGGWQGWVIANVRPEPTLQPSLSLLSSTLLLGEFAGASALVVGGSRGLGELVAKLIVAGGGDVVLTYAVGEADARRVQAEIRDFGGRCEIAPYDVRSGAREQLSRLPIDPDQLYYFATPPIFRQKTKSFDRARLDDFMAFYVHGFHDLASVLRAEYGEAISVFYPSSVAVESRPSGLTEYAMAKAAGELLCADMQSFERGGPVTMVRLPRLATDQTATLRAIDSADPIEVMLPIVRTIHAAVNPAKK